MCFYGIIWFNSWIYCFQGKKTFLSKEDTCYPKYAESYKPAQIQVFKWDGSILQMFHKKICIRYGVDY
jgi:hypothetical protein